MPILRRIVRREGAEIFDLVQGFVQSQALFALVSLDLFDLLDGKPLAPNELARAVDLPEDRMAILLRAGAALGLLIARKDGRFGLSRRGAALRGVPGLTDMIRHHGAFYSDMADPVALLRGEVDTELARFWPYVFGAASAEDPEAAARYSNLMARSQVMVAEDTLATVSLDGVSRLLDIGGGTGVFLSAAARRAPSMELALMELPPVLELAREHLASEGHGGRFTGYPGSFRDDPIPEGADAISLVRVLYDHDEKSVRALLAKAHAALKPGGRLIVSEPMSGGARPDPITDVYFAFYTLAMQTGRTRSQAEIAALCREAGFAGVETPKSLRPYITSVVMAHRDA